MSPAERRRLRDALPVERTPQELAAEEEEGDDHREECNDTVDALRTYFRKLQRSAYVTSNLLVFYPGEQRFAPDLMVVFDVEAHRRRRWLVVDEGKGLDFVLEIVDRGDRKKDLRDNVERYARLGIPEYVVFDLGRMRLDAFRLPALDARRYDRVPIDGSRFQSRVLGLELRIEGGRVRFLAGSAALPYSGELVERLEREMAEARARFEELLQEDQQLLEEEQRKREEEQRKREEEERRRTNAEAEVARLRAELEELRRRG